MNNNNKHLLFNIIYYKYSVLSGKAISNKTSYVPILDFVLSGFSLSAIFSFSLIFSK